MKDDPNTTEPQVEDTTAPAALAKSDALLELLGEETPRFKTLEEMETDARAEQTGVDFFDISTGVTWTVAWHENDRKQDYLNTLIAPYATLIQGRTAEGFRAFRRFEAKADARYVLLGWSGLMQHDANGELVEVPYSEEMAFRFLTEPKYRKIRDRIESFSKDENAFGIDREVMGKG